MGEDTVHRVVIPSTLEEACRVQELILEEVEKLDYNDNARFAIRLALDEALANAIHHGNRDDANKKVTVRYSATPQEVRITVCDEGPGFVPDTVPDPTSEENLIKPHGRGVMLIKAYMTRVEYSDRGRCITMTKARNCTLPD
ncbi:MAG: ATP-binding protein [Phycisphaera sp.]|nr:ATP-binding protein [Phycisphaera sp.]